MKFWRATSSCELRTCNLCDKLSPIIIMTWLNRYKVFWWFYCVDTKDLMFVWFCFFNLYELFPTDICANATWILVNSLFKIKIFIPFSASGALGCILINSSSSLTSDGIFGISPPSFLLPYSVLLPSVALFSSGSKLLSKFFHILILFVKRIFHSICKK